MNTDDVMGGSTTFTMISATQKFHDQNPKVYGAFVSALKEAQEMIMQDKPGAVKVLLESMGGGANAGSAEDMLAILNDPTTKYTIKPEHVMKYAGFMNEIGSLKNKPESIDALFFKGSDVSGGN
jgi:NitT/TauT family transport system substrate-binding protein